MPVVRIKEIIRKLLSSIFLLMTIMIFISCVPMYIHNQTNNSKYTNFNKTNNKTNNIWIYNNDDVKKEESLQISMWVATILVIGILLGIGIPCTYIVSYVLYSKGSILYYLNNLYNRLFRRNQNNEPAVHFQDDRIHWNGQANVHPQNL